MDPRREDDDADVQPPTSTFTLALAGPASVRQRLNGHNGIKTDALVQSWRRCGVTMDTVPGM